MLIINKIGSKEEVGWGIFRNFVLMKYPRIINTWLWFGLIMVFVQVMIGGITRLTDSGLSITEWEIVEGIFLPTSESAWENEFEQFKQKAKKQYETIHSDITLSDFKWIYFWEWFHRLWARMMGFVFIIPLFYFIWKGYIDRKLARHLLLIFFSASTVALFGWIMVASGLNDDTRTWVSAYKLVIHLILALFTLGTIYFTILYINNYKSVSKSSSFYKRFSLFLIFCFVIQVVFGGLMAGMKAAVVYPHWPMGTKGFPFFSYLMEPGLLKFENWLNYEPNVEIKYWIHFLHRSMAYQLAFLFVAFAFRLRRSYLDPAVRNIASILLFSVLVQLVLGIFTVLYSIGSIPLFLGVLHQLVAFIIFLLLLRIYYIFK